MIPMTPDDSKSYQLRVRVTAEERDLLEKIRLQRNRGETISDLVREAIHLLTHGQANGQSAAGSLSLESRKKLSHLATLLKREPHQVEEACVEGIFDLIEHKAEVPLIVMETQMHMNYRGHGEGTKYPWHPLSEEPTRES